MADFGNSTIRKVTPERGVTTLAGQADPGGPPRSVDGTGSGARFFHPTGVAVDSAGNVYVADTYNQTIRKVTAAGVVTTLAGGPTANFDYPAGVAVDSEGNVYVADTENQSIRKVTPMGSVITLAGLADGAGNSDGTGIAARFHQPHGVAVDSAGNVYVADAGNSAIRKITPPLRF